LLKFLKNLCVEDSFKVQSKYYFHFIFKAIIKYFFPIPTGKFSIIYKLKSIKKDFKIRNEIEAKVIFILEMQELLFIEVNYNAKKLHFERNSLS